MSRDVCLIDENGDIVTVPNHSDGGTYALGGTTKAELNITYNYSPFYFDTIDKKLGFHWLDGKKASETIERLERAVKTLGTERDNNYWNATKGNAGYALSILLDWAKAYPDAVWEDSR